MELNVLGGKLESCCLDPITGFYRDGFCRTGLFDAGSHTVCAKVTNEFLDFSLKAGNDLITPREEFLFPGLKQGDGWCVCASRWLEAVKAGYGCPIILSSTHAKALDIIPLELLMEYAFDLVD
ncbi:MAG: DUF2237 domain-containing protein [Bacteroidia bacterium]